jgi:hypothetical protein
VNEFLVTLRRKRTVWEHSTVVAQSTNPAYAERDAKLQVGASGWEVTKTDVQPLPSVITSVEST